MTEAYRLCISVGLRDNAFAHAYAGCNIFIRTIVWNHAIPGFRIQRYGLRLVEACFKNTCMKTGFPGPPFKRIKDHSGNTSAAVIRVNEHPFYFNGLIVIGSECTASYSMVVYIGYDHMVDIAEGIELRIEWMVIAIPYLQFVIKHVDQHQEIRVG